MKWVPKGGLTAPVGYIHEDGHKLIRAADDRWYLEMVGVDELIPMSRKATFDGVEATIARLQS